MATAVCIVILSMPYEMFCFIPKSFFRCALSGSIRFRFFIFCLNSGVFSNSI